MAAGGGNFERPFGRRLTLDLRQVGKGHIRRRRRIAGTPQDLAPGKVRTHLQAAWQPDTPAHRERGFRRAFHRQHEGAAVTMRVVGHGQGAPDWTQLTGQCKLPGEFILAEPVGGNLRGGSENAERDRQIEAAAFLGQVCGREIDGNAAGGKFESTH